MHEIKSSSKLIIKRNDSMTCVRTRSQSLPTMAAFYAFIVLCVSFLISQVHGVRTYRDPDLLSRIPDSIKKEVDAMVKNKLDQVISLHYNSDENVISTSSDKTLQADFHHNRVRRQVPTNATVAPRYSEWSFFSYCSVKCGGGIRARTRQCLEGDCDPELLMEQQECGTLPCVSGTFTLDGLSPVWKLALKGAKLMKFFTIVNTLYLGKLTEDEITIYVYRKNLNDFVSHQTISTQKGISFSLLVTKRGYYLVVLEKKSTSYFPGVFSRMYLYDPMMDKFQDSNPVRFTVYEPSALTTFQVYGTAHMAVVNRRNKVMSSYGGGSQESRLICNGESANLSCAPGTYISISNVFYGRLNNWDCPGSVLGQGYGQYFNYCYVNGIKDEIITKCENLQTCPVEATTVQLLNGRRDPCVYTEKYLKVYYTCTSLSYMGTPNFYRWDGVGLSVVGSENLFTYGPEDLESFHIHHNAFVVVANYINDQQQHHLDSEIYMYDLEIKRFKSFQKLRTDGALDFEFFVVGQGISREYFLAVANHIKVFPDGRKSFEVESVIYKWNWNLFVPFQCIKTYGAKKWTAVTAGDGEFTLTLTDLHGNVTFYSYDGWRFNKVEKLTQDTIFQDAESTSMAVLGKESTGYIILYAIQPIDDVDSKNVYSLQYKKVFPNFDVLESCLKSVQEMNRTIYNIILPRSDTFNTSYQNVKDDIVFIDDVTHLNDGKTFQDIRVEGTTIVHNATVDYIHLSPSDIERIQLQDEFLRTENLHSEMIVKAESFMTRIVTKSTEQVITGAKTFTEKIQINQLMAKGNVTVIGQTNNQELYNVYNTTVFVDRDHDLKGEFIFTEDVEFDSITVQDKINNVSTDRILTTNTPQKIQGKKMFANIKFASNVSENINVGGLVNGINVSNLVLLHTDQNITATHSFLGNVSMLENINVGELINGQNIAYLAQDTLMKNEDGIITAHKIFNRMTIREDLNMSSEKTVNDIDVSEFTKMGVYLDAVDMFGNVTFNGNVTFKSSVLLAGMLNQVDLNTLVFTDQPTTFYQPITFKRNITCSKDLKIDGLINGLNIPGDVLDTFSNQTISGTKTFDKNVSILKDLNVQGMIDNINMTTLLNDAILNNKSQIVTGFKTFMNISASDLTLSDCSDDKCEWLQIFQKLHNDTVRIDDEYVKVNGLKIFSKGLTIGGNLTVSGQINNITLPGELLIQGKNETIYGQNNFENVSFYGNLTVKKINGYNISDLYRRVLRKNGDNQTITGHWTFSNTTTFKGKLDINGTIDGVDVPRDVVLTNQNYTFSNRKLFNEIHAKTLLVDSMVVDGKIDGVNITALKEELVTLSGDIIVKGKKTFKNHVSFAGNWTVPGLIDGVNISELANRAMRLDEDQIITGKKAFNAPVSVDNDNLEVEGLIDGVNISQLAKHSINVYQSPITLTHNITFNDITVKGTVSVQGLVNGLNISNLIQDALRRSGDQIITGAYQVENLTILGELQVKELLNGMKFSEEVIVLDNPGSITGAKHFEDGFKATNITTDLLNDLNITRFVDQIVFIDEDTFITGNKVFTSDLTVGLNLEVRNLVNGVNWTHLSSTTLLRDGNQTVQVPTHFARVHIKDSATMEGLLNSFNLTDFEKNLVYKCQGPNKPITAHHTYDVTNVLGESKILSITTSGSVNKINISKLANEAVYTYGNFTITGKKQVRNLYSNNLNAGQVNGFTVPDDFVRLNETNAEITGQKDFLDDVKVTENVTISELKTVNGHDLSELQQNLVTIDGEASITTDVEFTGSLAIAKNLQVGLINKVNVSGDELLLTSGDQTITGMKTFDRIDAHQEVSTVNHINGYNLKKMLNESILMGQSNSITGEKIIHGEVLVTGNLDTNLVDGVNVSVLFSGNTEISNYLDHSLDKLNNTLLQNRQSIAQIVQAISNVRQSIDYFVEFDEIPLNYQSISLDVLQDEKQTWLVAGALIDVDGNRCTNTSIFWRSADNQTFMERTKVLTSAVTGSQLVKYNDDIHYLTSTNKVAGNCLNGLNATEYYGIVHLYDNQIHSFKRARSVKVEKSKNLAARVVGSSLYTVFTQTQDSTTDNSDCVEQILIRFGENKTIAFGNNSCDVTKSILVTSDGDFSMVAVLGSDAKDSSKNLGIYLISMSENEAQTVHYIQSISTYYASDVISMDTRIGAFLVIANTYDSSPDSLSVSYTVPVFIHRFNEASGQFEEYQQLDIYAAQLISHFEFGSYNYLAIATFDQSIVVLKHRGVGKWQAELTIPTRGFDAVKGMKFWVDSNNDIYLAVLTDDQWNDEYPSKIVISKGVLSSGADGSDLAEQIDL